MPMTRVYSDEEAKALIAAEYEDEDPYTEGPAVRSGYGRAHAETPVDGEIWCEVCGWVEKPTADPRYHPEQYPFD